MLRLSTSAHFLKEKHQCRIYRMEMYIKTNEEPLFSALCCVETVDTDKSVGDVNNKNKNYFTYDICGHHKRSNALTSRRLKKLPPGASTSPYSQVVTPLSQEDCTPFCVFFLINNHLPTKLLFIF
ncbi:hypothetical protein AVEN_62505-1 [Araneus ventricosus]|uniref:Uncharacterized protein n=1 Tax=Araneus ventricosus TaxID=182803 RepID=A0A4Y2Q636_ARAVE|nr:hypothetical protein AVEN_62505-1 [Araneus ventricosus]